MEDIMKRLEEMVSELPEEPTLAPELETLKQDVLIKMAELFMAIQDLLERV